MTPLKTITKPTIRAMERDVLAALQSVADKYGVALAPKGATYSDTAVTIKMEFAVKAADGAALTPERVSFERYATMYGLEASDLGKVVTINGVDYRIDGLLSSRSTRFPILATRVIDGATFKHNALTVQRALGRR